MTRGEQGFDPALYDADFFTWTQRQAVALRAMPRDASIDVEHVAEEIEDLGKSQSQKVFSLLTLVMQHLIKLHAASTSRDAAHWYQEASNFQASARKAFSPGMKQLIDTNEAWADAWHGTHRFLNDIGSDMDRSTEACPFTLDELLARPFDIDAAAAKLASAEGHSDGGISHMTRNEQASPSATYDDDFFTWTQEQAAALRLTRDAISKSVDIEHVAEEIEDLGKRDLREVGSFLARLIEHLLKIDACQDSRDRPHWLSEAGHLHSSAVDAFTPGMRQLLSLEKIWRRGCKDATLCLEEMNVAFTPPVTCLFTLDQLLAEDFDLRAALRTLAEQRSARDTPRP